MSQLTIAQQEFLRLCSLIDRIPYGECQLIALMLYRAVPTSRIVRGVVHCEDGEVDHHWIEVNGEDIDPLAETWGVKINGRSDISTVCASTLLEEYKEFINDFPEPSEASFFPLRWKVKDELLR